jgi:hypothetical protein
VRCPGAGEPTTGILGGFPSGFAPVGGDGGSETGYGSPLARPWAQPGEPMTAPREAMPSVTTVTATSEPSAIVATYVTAAGQLPQRDSGAAVDYDLDHWRTVATEAATRHGTERAFR